MGDMGVGGIGRRILYYYLAGRASEIEGMEYFIARKEKSDIINLWKEFLEKMEHGRDKLVLRWWKHLW
jgi:hypothetical protein